MRPASLLAPHHRRIKADVPEAVHTATSSRAVRPASPGKVPSSCTPNRVAPTHHAEAHGSRRPASSSRGGPAEAAKEEAKKAPSKEADSDGGGKDAGVGASIGNWFRHLSTGIGESIGNWGDAQGTTSQVPATPEQKRVGTTRLRPVESVSSNRAAHHPRYPFAFQILVTNEQLLRSSDKEVLPSTDEEETAEDAPEETIAAPAPAEAVLVGDTVPDAAAAGSDR